MYTSGDIKISAFDFAFLYYRKGYGIIEKTKDKNIYKINNIVLKAIVNELGFLEKFVYVKNPKSEFIFTFSNEITNEIKKEILKNKKKKKEAKKAYDEMHRVFSKDFYVRVINRSERIVSYVRLLDAFFVGNKLYVFDFSNRSFRADYWVLDKKDLLKTLIRKKDFFKQCYEIVEMLEMVGSYRLMKSDFFVFLKKVEKNLIKTNKINKKEK